MAERGARDRRRGCVNWLLPVILQLAGWAIFTWLSFSFAFDSTGQSRPLLVVLGLLTMLFVLLPEFLAAHQVNVVASLPCYLEDNCDAQRGSGVFAKSIRAIEQLNQLGYGISDSGLELDLVYNPVGTGLPPDQESLQRQYRDQLWNRYQIRFDFQDRLLLAEQVQSPDNLLQLGNGIAAQDSVVTAIACFTLWPDSYEDVVANAILLGGDTDTIAAMAGAISGAHLGIHAISSGFLECLEDDRKGKSYLERLAEQLFEKF